MIKDLHNNEPVISAGEGWQQMQLLLNQHLPVKNNIFHRSILARYAAVALVFGIFIFTGLQFGNDQLPVVTQQGMLSTFINTAIANNPFLNPNTNPTKQPIQSAVPFNEPASIAHSSPRGKNVFYDITNNPEDRATPNAGGDVNINNKFVYGIIEKQVFEKLSSPVQFGNTTVAMSKDDMLKKIKSPSWNLLAGAGVNLSVHNAQNMQPYPVAEARYNINERFYIAAGIGAWSPVSTNVTGVSKTVFLNDTVNNIRQYNEKTTYHHLQYADLSLSGGVKITPKLSVQAGLQASLLMHRQTSKVLEPYDYQMNNVFVPPNYPVSTAAAGSGQAYEVAVKKVDYRFTTAVRYSFPKATLGVNYQYGLQSTGKGNNINGGNNHVLSLNVLFRIK